MTKSVLRLTCSRDGFRRCGVAHAAGSTDWPIDRFTDEEVMRFRADPTFEVEIVEVPDSSALAGAPPAEGTPERAAAVQAAIAALPAGEAAKWLKDGRPDARALTEILGWNVGSKERDEVWSRLQAAP